MFEIKVPDIGDFDEVAVAEVLVSVGDEVESNDSLISLESDKATMEVPADRAGKITELLVDVGDNVSEGTVIAKIEVAETQAEDPAEAKEPEPVAEPEPPSPPPAKESAPAPASADAGPREPPVPHDAGAVASGALAHASPSVRKFARELGVDLVHVQGSGPKGRILQDDVQGYVKSVMHAKPAADGAGALGIAAAPKIDFAKFGPVEEVDLSRIRKISGANLHRNWVTIPHVTQHDEADVTDMEAFRKAHAEAAKAQGFKLTPLVFLIKAVVRALQTFPDFNASLDPSGKRLVRKQYFHIGIAVDTPDGLVVPVLRDCDQKSLYDLAAELAEISGRAREKKLSPKEMQGGCFSISSLGGIGGTSFTPIVNAPEVAILGVARSSWKPQMENGEFVPRLMLPLSLSYDHRVIDGAAGARFTRHIAESLTDIRRLLL